MHLISKKLGHATIDLRSTKRILHFDDKCTPSCTIYFWKNTYQNKEDLSMQILYRKQDPGTNTVFWRKIRKLGVQKKISSFPFKIKKIPRHLNIGIRQIGSHKFSFIPIWKHNLGRKTEMCLFFCKNLQRQPSQAHRIESQQIFRTH